MPSLHFGNEEISFEEVQVSESLPLHIRQAAALIAGWNAGKEIFYLHTSGSTGTPKSIELHRKYILHSARLTATTFGLKENDLLLCCLPVNKIAGFMMVMRALVNRCDLLLVPPSSNPFSELDQKIKIDFAAFVPMQIQAILNEGYDQIKMLNRMKAILVGGADIAETLMQRLQIISAPVYHTYGMTETYTHVAIRRLNGPHASKKFFPLEGVNMQTDARGCLVISSPVTGKEPVITNDLVEFDAEGSFRFKGRADFIINSGGLKIQPEEIEKVAYEVAKNMQLHQIEIVVAAMPHEVLGQQVILVVEGPAWEEKLASDFLASVKNKLEKHKQPKAIRFIPEIPKTSNGKVDRISLMESFVKRLAP